MTDMMRDDLIERLRNFEGSDALGNGDFSLLHEAADAIEAAQKDAARYRCLSAMATQQADYLGPIFRIDVRRSEPYLFNFDAAVDAAMQQGEQR